MASKVHSIHDWLTTCKTTFPFFDGFLLFGFWEGEVFLWPPSLQNYTMPEDRTQVPHVYASSIDEPGMFRISYRSLMPYHGYVISSPVHDRLFSELSTDMPEHVTLLPLLQQDEILGFFYMERKKVADLKEIPNLSRLELQWDELAFLFNRLYQPLHAFKQGQTVVRS